MNILQNKYHLSLLYFPTLNLQSFLKLKLETTPNIFLK